MKRVVLSAILIVLFLPVFAYAQTDNSCKYPFIFPQQQFSFCMTALGTLASIQSPIGTNLLDANNPVEGWYADIRDDAMGEDGGAVIPGLGIATMSPMGVRQPNGPGKLPLTFVYSQTPAFTETISAYPSQRTITITLSIGSCHGCYWSGTVSRVANVRADGNSMNFFGHSAYAAFGYLQHGLMLSVASPDCAGTDPNGAAVSVYRDCSLGSTPFQGPGAAFASWLFDSYHGRIVSMRATYRAF